MNNATRICLLDDDSDDRELFSEAAKGLEQAVICECFEDGKEGLSTMLSAEFTKPDIIFLDLNMPTMDGWQFLEHIRKHDSLSGVPVIIYSTSSAPRDQDYAKAMGAICFVTKPYNFSKVKLVLQIVVRNIQKNTLHQACAEIRANLSAT